MAALDQVRINGRYFNRNNAVLKINGFRFKEFTTVKWGRKRVRGEVRRADEANSIAGYTTGQVQYSPILIGLRLESKQLLEEQLALAGLGSPGAAVSTITLTYQMIGKAPIQIVFEDCVYNGGDNEVGEDPAVATTDEVEFQCTGITVNGVSLEEIVLPF